MLALDFATTLLMTASVAAALALLGVVMAPALGHSGALPRLNSANLLMAAGLVWRAAAANPATAIDYAIVWTALTVAPLLFVSALRSANGMVNRDARLTGIGVGATCCLLLAAMTGNAQLTGVVASVTTALAFGCGLRTAIDIRSAAQRLPRRILRITFIVCIAFCAAHGLLRVHSMMQGMRNVIPTAATYAGVLWLLLTLNLSMLLSMYLRLAERVGNLAYVDELTGLPNRRGLSARMRELGADGRVMRGAIVVIDLDHFKQVNDRWGHAIGDHVLRQFATRLTLHAREQDVVVRFGGEEFGWLLPDVDAAQAASIIEAMRHDLASKALLVELAASDRQPQPVRITASYGIAELGCSGRQLQADIQRADEALYRAKRAGRDRVVIWTPAVLDIERDAAPRQVQA